MKFENVASVEEFFLSNVDSNIVHFVCEGSEGLINGNLFYSSEYRSTV